MVHLPYFWWIVGLRTALRIQLMLMRMGYFNLWHIPKSIWPMGQLKLLP